LGFARHRGGSRYVCLEWLGLVAAQRCNVDDRRPIAGPLLMRSDLEAAMAAVIGSRSEHSRFFDDPKKFAETYSLEGPEIASLISMGSDLADLTGSFVRKRQGYLRMNGAKTLEMLGPEGDALLAEFVDTHPMPEWHRLEAGSFGEFLIERTAALRDDTPRSWIIADMARFEKHQHDSFWDATVPVEPQHRSDPSVQTPSAGRGKSQHAAIRLRNGANIASFGWDMRLLFRYGFDQVPLLQPDPCQLLFFYKGTATGFRVTRLKPLEATAFGALSQGSAVDVEVMRDALPDDVDLDRLLSRFLWQEVVQWL
jgi:hypothetical protein